MTSTSSPSSTTATRRFVLDRVATPIGTMLVVTDREGCLRALDWQEYEARMHRLLRLHYGKDGVVLDEGRAPAAVRDALEAYFKGDLSALDTLPVATGGTAFQREVWAALRAIPAGETLSYGALAKKIARPAAVRAVGLANGANPIGVVVPCHRVIGANATLTGYAGGIERKRWLLTHEGVS
ncbi:MAG: methylated-DNA-[protein]-cysteine S-methyltransferase [Myxococcales bacterium]|nr:methylated-DNA-[protein]-cysteine S-methyltransferase [Myxococcales bacterium]